MMLPVLVIFSAFGAVGDHNVTTLFCVEARNRQPTEGGNRHRHLNPEGIGTDQGGDRRRGAHHLPHVDVFGLYHGVKRGHQRGPRQGQLSSLH